MQNIKRWIPFLGAALLSACGGVDGSAGDLAYDRVPEEERYGGTAVATIIGDIPDINPLTSTDHNADQVEQYVLFTPVIGYDENFRPVPRYAKSWEVNADTSELTFHLRDDVYWHDGVKTTAYDLKFAYDLANDPNTGFPNSAFWTNYGEAEAVDSFTFKVKMEPHAEYMDPWRTFSAAPRHLLEGVPAAEIRNHPYGKNPVGNGPFKFVSYQPGQRWTFEANSDYPEELGGRPYLDRLVFRVIPEPTTQLAELLTGNVDYYIAPPAEQAAAIKNSGNARLVTFADRAFVILGWNERREPFDDVRVRRALTMAIDKQAIIDGVVHGYGTVANSTVPPFHWAHDPAAGAEVGYDPEQAKALLAEAGWVDRNGDGILENEAGKPLRFTIKTNKGNQIRADIMQVVQADLRKIGVDAQSQVLEWGTLLNQINTPTLRDFDALVIGWVTEFKVDDTDLFHCEKREEPYQWIGYCDPETDRMLEQLQKITRRDEAKPLWSAYQRKIAQDQPYTFLYFQERLEGVHNRLRSVDPDARGDLVGVSDWWILPDQRREQTASR